ncbi:hypothetical protein ACFX4N_24020 [Priestia sp. YIM B13551]|uniref:hypothetical protein n=1 Tax=Priestia sp. YIM B13551 TaxID=3366306 RepID=UPI0036714A3A
MAALSKEYIEAIADAVSRADAEQQQFILQLLEVHPQGQEIYEEVTRVLLGKLADTIFEAIGAESKEEEEKVNEEEVSSLSQLLSNQITAKKLSEQIREQVQQQELTESIRARFFDYTATAEPIEDAVDLGELIRGQVTLQNLTSLIREQVEEQYQEDEEDTEEEFFETDIQDILDEMVDDIVEDGDIKDIFDINHTAIIYYEIGFRDDFYAKAAERGIEDLVEYKADYTAYIMTELASYVVASRGYQLSFRVIDGVTVPALS